MSLDEAKFKASLLMNVANTFDLATTTTGLQRGLKEGNPIARYMIEQMGIAAFSAVKLAMPLVLVAISELATRPKAKAFYGMLMATYGIVFSLAAINNLMLLSLKKATS